MDRLFTPALAPALRLLADVAVVRQDCYALLQVVAPNFAQGVWTQARMGLALQAAYLAGMLTSVASYFQASRFFLQH